MSAAGLSTIVYNLGGGDARDEFFVTGTRYPISNPTEANADYLTVKWAFGTSAASVSWTAVRDNSGQGDVAAAIDAKLIKDPQTSNITQYVAVTGSTTGDSNGQHNAHTVLYADGGTSVTTRWFDIRNGRGLDDDRPFAIALLPDPNFDPDEWLVTVGASSADSGDLDYWDS